MSPRFCWPITVSPHCENELTPNTPIICTQHCSSSVAQASQMVPLCRQDAFPSLWLLRGDDGLDAYLCFLSKSPHCLQVPLWADLHRFSGLISTAFLLQPHTPPWCFFPRTKTFLFMLNSKPRILFFPNIVNTDFLTSSECVLKHDLLADTFIDHLIEKQFSVTLLPSCRHGPISYRYCLWNVFIDVPSVSTSV